MSMVVGAAGVAFRPAAGRLCLALSAASLGVVFALATAKVVAAQQGAGCLSQGKLYPEGARMAPDPRSRIAVAGVFVCRNGRWVFERT
jgi:hypothetical protein